MAVILVHGGAGRHRQPPARLRQALEEAAGAGHARRKDGAGAMVVAAVDSLEACGILNAGAGSARQADGRIRQDAALAEGGEGEPGLFAGVIGLPGLWPAARLAALLMARPNPLLAGPEAARAAAAAGFVERLPALRPHRSWVRCGQGSPGTVGAVAHDGSRWAACTSTGGRGGSAPGRVGDSALPGCGTLADPRGAVSATGLGEAIFRLRLAEFALGKVAGEGAAGAAAAALAALAADPRGEGQGGLILVTSEGEVATAFNTESMPTARRL